MKFNIFVVLVCLWGFVTISGSSARQISLAALDLEQTKYSPGDVLRIEAESLIQGKDFYKAFLYSTNKKKFNKKHFKKHRHKLKVVRVEADSLYLQLPRSIPYGDYDLYIKFKSKFFKSKFYKMDQNILLRPSAANLNLEHRVFLQQESLYDYFMNMQKKQYFFTKKF